MNRWLAPIALFLVVSPFALAQRPRRADGDWKTYREQGCIGGSGCRDRSLRVALDDRPVLAVRFYADDSVGDKAEGALRVKIDSNTIRAHIDIPRRGETFTIDVDELTGRYLVFEPATNDEVQIRDIAVLYGRSTIRPVPRDRFPSGDSGWRAYPRAGACIGGDQCRKNGTRITIALDSAPVLGVRFFAHDAIGQRADGKLNVRIDNTTVAGYIDVQRSGKRHELTVNGIRGSRLVIETASDDEVEVKDIEVLYGRGGGRSDPGDDRDHRRGSRGPGEITDEGGCIGGNGCGGRTSRIRINIRDRSVESIRFYARDDVGARATGALRIRIDDEVLEYSLDVPRDGKTFTVDGRHIAGDYIYFEPATNDEVVIKDIRVRFRDDD